MAYRIGLIVWLLTIVGSIVMALTSSGWFELVGLYYSIFLGIGSTILFIIYSTLVFLHKRNKVAFWMVLAIILAAIFPLYMYNNLTQALA